MYDNLNHGIDLKIYAYTFNNQFWWYSNMLLHTCIGLDFKTQNHLSG